MRELADAARVREFMRLLGRAADREADVYFTGGATAVLVGWRPTTIDVDIKIEPELHSLLRAIPQIKDELRINVELASPAEFIPVPDGWMERSISIGREAKVSFHHFDPYAQALAKLERAHDRDLADVQALVEAGLVEPAQALDLFVEIEPELYRFPAIDPAAFKRSVEEAFA
jgi:Nucleotidyltransferase of unknown function (DUF6036)